MSKSLPTPASRYKEFAGETGILSIAADAHGPIRGGLVAPETDRFCELDRAIWTIQRSEQHERWDVNDAAFPGHAYDARRIPEAQDLASEIDEDSRCADGWASTPCLRECPGTEEARTADLQSRREMTGNVLVNAGLARAQLQ
ncbi:hypothetical protein TOPH_05966 [Tolypocladium ophioglossoides CBS 100239]|uniref:Uncharacterized protein n=1 Tax=Tolypocladium ophioglossoides (strain CBS 100239) TaxID=1163406 RepID=A0A0L0N5R0_TOLOC|nr:hypothetical protein TOPH_05966 [Tolypocladium ophioglossoides CBS 100239]